MEAVVIAKQYGKSVIFREAKNQNGVPGFIGFIKMTYEDGAPNFRLGFKPGNFPVTEKVAERTIALPFYNNLQLDNIEYAVRSLKTILKQ